MTKIPAIETMHGSKKNVLVTASAGAKEFMHPAKHGNLPGNPLTTTGQKVMRNMRESYGSNKKAKEVFYASINANKPGSKKWHG